MGVAAELDIIVDRFRPIYVRNNPLAHVGGCVRADKDHGDSDKESRGLHRWKNLSAFCCSFVDAEIMRLRLWPERSTLKRGIGRPQTILLVAAIIIGVDKSGQAAMRLKFKFSLCDGIHQWVTFKLFKLAQRNLRGLLIAKIEEFDEISIWPRCM